MKDPASTAIFEKAYPKKAQGSAFTWRCDGTIIVTNSEENKDVMQTYEMPIGTGFVQSFRGQMGVHQFLIAKEGKQDFWFQVNGEYRDRIMHVALRCRQEPSIKIAPVTAGRKVFWNPSSSCLELELSIAEGAVEVTVRK